MYINECYVGECLVKLVCGDIREESVQAIVCPATANLKPASGLASGILKRAGKSIEEEVRDSGREVLPIGEVRESNAGGLKCKKILHLVMPVYCDGNQGENTMLRVGFENVLKIADRDALMSIALPVVPSGAFSFPTEEWANVLFLTLQNLNNTNIREIRVVNDDIFVMKAFELFMIRYLSQKTENKPTAISH